MTHWFVFTSEAELIDLGECASFDEAEIEAERRVPGCVVWIADPETVQQWRAALGLEGSQ